MVPIDTAGEAPTPLDISRKEIEKAMSELGGVLKLYKERASSVSKLNLTETDEFLGIERYEKEPGTTTEKSFPSRTSVPIMKSEDGEFYIVAADGTVYRIDKRGLSVISREVEGNVYGLLRDLVPWGKGNKEDANFLPLLQEGGFDGSEFLFIKEEYGRKVKKTDRVRAFRFRIDEGSRPGDIREQARELKDAYDKGGVFERASV